MVVMVNGVQRRCLPSDSSSQWSRIRYSNPLVKIIFYVATSIVFLSHLPRAAAACVEKLEERYSSSIRFMFSSGEITNQPTVQPTRRYDAQSSAKVTTLLRTKNDRDEKRKTKEKIEDKPRDASSYSLFSFTCEWESRTRKNTFVSTISARVKTTTYVRRV